MDRNNIIGIVLIFVLFIVWQQVTAPSKEQIEEQRRIQDSIALVQERADSMARIAKDQAMINNQPKVPEITNLPDSIVDLQLAQSHGIFAPSAKGEEKTITLQNELSKVSISSKGARITSIELKEHFKIIKDTARQDVKVPLLLMEDEKNRFEYFLPISNLPAGGVSSSGLFFVFFLNHQ